MPGGTKPAILSELKHSELNFRDSPNEARVLMQRDRLPQIDGSQVFGFNFAKVPQSF